SYVAKAPATFKAADAKGKEFAGLKFTVQVAPEDCTGCGVCVFNCPARQKDAEKKETGHRAIDMVTQLPIRHTEAENFGFFMNIPDPDPSTYNKSSVKGSQFARPLFEFSGACAGCGETAYIKLMSQLFGDRAMIANATGCSSIYGGNLPTTPYCTRPDGRGPSWANSLFEDNAEFGMGMRLAVDKFNGFALELIDGMLACDECKKNAELISVLEAIKTADQTTQTGIEQQRERVAKLKAMLGNNDHAKAKQLVSLADYLVKKSVWIIGGDGWAYDIGYGGLDHVLASGRNVNILVVDTEVYSNTGGQASKSTPLGAVAKFASSGKQLMKKDLGMIAMTYGNIYVATVAMGANPTQVVKAFAEAEAYDGPSLIIAYSNCIAQGINMEQGLNNQKEAVASGHCILYRYNPDLKNEGKNPLQLDSKLPTAKYSDFAAKENRFKQLKKMNPEHAQEMMDKADKLVSAKFDLYTKLAGLDACSTKGPGAE
ncbi:TPA: pyruvate:ferredoxin (flavodoxin) oxidoreductase, partial [Candidatus Sumerlaeota bacterium]|nr:pyruvate:ferredoxin (flavodoxin) oxidoreductase [Candidatus Sumerlaeota bacterium]